MIKKIDKSRNNIITLYTQNKEGQIIRKIIPISKISIGV